MAAPDTPDMALLGAPVGADDVAPRTPPGTVTVPPLITQVVLPPLPPGPPDVPPAPPAPTDPVIESPGCTVSAKEQIVADWPPEPDAPELPPSPPTPPPMSVISQKRAHEGTTVE
jgi:hypothetical protein